MKRILLLCIVLTLTGLFSVTHAQNRAKLTDKALSAQYEQEIKVVNSEIKTLKLKLKANKSDYSLRSELDFKQRELKALKADKKVVDNAIKSKAASDKAAKKADKAIQKADKAQYKADKKARDAQRLR